MTVATFTFLVCDRCAARIELADAAMWSRTPDADLCTTCLRSARPGLAVRAVAEMFDVRSCDILAPTRGNRWCSEARQLVMWHLRSQGMSYPRIGRVLGRDHSTVMTGVCRVDERIERSALWRSYVTRLEASLADSGEET